MGENSTMFASYLLVNHMLSTQLLDAIIVRSNVQIRFSTYKFEYSIVHWNIAQ